MICSFGARRASDWKITRRGAVFFFADEAALDQRDAQAIGFFSIQLSIEFGGANSRVLSD